MGKVLAKMFYWKKKEVVTTIPGSLWDIDVEIITDNADVYIKKQFKDLKEENTKAYLVINVSDACNLTGAYFSQLKKLDEELSPLGLKIIAVPCLQYDKDKAKELTMERCGIRAEDAIRNKFKVNFTVLKSTIVNGVDCCDLYKWLRANCDYFNKNISPANKKMQKY